MKQRAEMSGQIMLTGAFILAITLVSIALILNNVVYFNNVSHMGYMEHSESSDISIKNMVAQEAINAYDKSHGDVDAFNRTMLDVANSLNNVTLPEGIKVVISPPYFFNKSYITTLTYPSTKFNLTICTKDATKTYEISTNYFPPPPPPLPSAALNCSVTITSNKTMTAGLINDCAFITVQVLDNKSQPLPGVTVDLHAILGGFWDENGNDANHPVTNSAGYAMVYYIPSGTGVDTLNASVGLYPSRSLNNLSNNVTITNYGICTHIVDIGTPKNISTGFDFGNGNNKNYWVNFTVLITVAVPPTDYDFSNFNVGAIFNEAWSDNVQFMSASDMGNFTEPHVKGPLIYQRNIRVKLGWKNEHQNFVSNVSIAVNALCNDDYALYSNTKTFTVTRP